jgi:membrane protein YqaA with SNARE-associated domain
MINWNSLILVAVVAIGSSVGLVTVFSLGMRLLTNARNIKENTKKKDGVKVSEAVYRIGAYLMFTICSSAVLYGIYLIVPYFHLDK